MRNVVSGSDMNGRSMSNLSFEKGCRSTVDKGWGAINRQSDVSRDIMWSVPPKTQ
jgi:hypothetical protein